MTISQTKESAQLTLPAGGVFRLDNGADRTDLTISRQQNAATTANPSGVADLSGGTFIASLDALTLGLKSGGSSGSANGTLILGSSAANGVNVNTVVIGSMAGAASGSPVARGTLTFWRR